jgi:2-polyprenyl-6-hydroxyphenyl methylase/3-demethylubiquinone-9 3-methyltransferase
VGCGGGLVSEPLAKIGFQVTGIDASQENVIIAQEHAHTNKIDVTYSCTTTDDLIHSNKRYDVVLALEIVEHVDNVEAFISHLAKLCKPNGLVILSTLNKTLKSFLFAIVGAEYLTQILPIGTHEYKKFIEPAKLVHIAEMHKLSPIDLIGMKYEVIKKKWTLSQDMKINYFATFTHRM